MMTIFGIWRTGRSLRSTALIGWLALYIMGASKVSAFPTKPVSFSRVQISTKSRLKLCLAQKNDPPPDYSRELRLREEAESPFRKVRFLGYASLGAGALTSLAVSMARVAAALSGINQDLLQESATNAAIDIAGLVVIGFLYKRDLDAQESRLKRASKGAELAKLQIRASKRLLYDDTQNEDATFSTTLASLRRGRGIEKRVVIAAAGKETIASVLKEAADLSDALMFSDLVIVPVILPQCEAPTIEAGLAIPECVCLPSGMNWKRVMEDESREAESQGVDIEKEGYCVILKKNGRVGQRTRGIFLRRMVGEVEERRAMGMDVKNI